MALCVAKIPGAMASTWPTVRKCSKSFRGRDPSLVVVAVVAVAVVVPWPFGSVVAGPPTIVGVPPFAIPRQPVGDTWDRSTRDPALLLPFQCRYPEWPPNTIDNNRRRL